MFVHIKLRKEKVFFFTTTKNTLHLLRSYPSKLLKASFPNIPIGGRDSTWGVQVVVCKVTFTHLGLFANQQFLHVFVGDVSFFH